MTAGNLPTDVLAASQVAELINGLVKALRAFQMYLPNNPIYQRASENVRTAFQPIWAAMDELVLNVAETDFVWEDQVVYHQLNKSESLAWGLFKDGMRSLTIRRGAEEEELPRFLETINRARFLPADAGDDLLTLLWEQEFELIQYHFIEFFGEGGGALPEQTGTYRRRGHGRGAGGHAAAARGGGRRRRRRGRRASSISRSSIPRSTSSTKREINYVAGEVEDEYKRDVRGRALNVLFDLVELEGDTAIRGEILGMLETLFPNLLNARDFRTAARGAAGGESARGPRAPGLLPEQRQRLDGFVAKLSEPAIVSQLVQSLDEAPTLAGEPEVAEVLRELRGTALEPLLTWMPNLSSPPLRSGARGRGRPARERAHRRRCCGILRTPTREALGAVIALCGRLQLASGGARARRDHRPRRSRRAARGGAGARPARHAGARSPSSSKAIEDADRAVRLAAVRAVGAPRLQGRAQAHRGRSCWGRP